MFVASVHGEYANHDAAFGTEVEAEAWLEGEMRRTGASRGVVYEQEDVW